MASDRNWTTQQRAAIEYTAGSLLVSAAAGSGKTAVLAGRCAHLVCDAPEPCSIDELLVVTFTKAASAEMKARIEREILKAIDKHPPSDRLRRQRALIGRLSVGTLHSFCGDLVRRHFHLLGIDPDVRQLADDEQQLLKLDCLREVFEARYGASPSRRFEQLLDRYAAGDDSSLTTTVRQLHALLGSMIDPKDWSERSRARIEEASTGKLEDSALGKALIGILKTQIQLLARRTAAAESAIKKLSGFDKYLDYLKPFGPLAKKWDALLARGIDPACQAIAAFEVPRLPSLSNDLPHKERAKAAVESVTGLIKKGVLAELGGWTSQDWQSGLAEIAPHAQELIDVTAAFAARYESRKRELRAIDYNDLEHLALKLLRDDSQPGLAPSAVARSCQQRFRFVLVDEYQDINAVQDAILTLISRESADTTTGFDANFFCVGDVKQSIYRFRLAEPTLFLLRDKRLRASSGKSGKVIDLRENFRSRKPLLDVINSICSRLLVGGDTEIDYDKPDKAHWLQAGADYPTAESGKGQFPGAPVELHLLPAPPRANAKPDKSDTTSAALAEFEQFEREAAFVAQRILQLLGRAGGKPAQVCERDQHEQLIYRDIRPADIAILLRTVRTKADRFDRILRRFGITARLDSMTGFFDATEVQDMLALLQVLDNQKQDIPLAAVLRSPIARLSAPEDLLVRARLASPPGAPFHEAVEHYARTKSTADAVELQTFLAQIERLRVFATRNSVADLIELIYEETAYPTWCRGITDGRQRAANLQDLLDRARAFDSTSFRGLSRFLSYLNTLAEESDLGMPSIATDDQQAVRIMSVHKSKGLEFPVVFIPDLSKKHNREDLKQRICFDRDAGLGMRVIDLKNRTALPSLASVVVHDALERKMLAEELRVLYVAMTRAKEHLILVGSGDEDTVSDWEASADSECDRFSPEFVLDGNSFQDWLGPAAIRANQDRADSVRITTTSPDEMLKTLLALDRRGTDHPIDPLLLDFKPLAAPPVPDAIADQARELLTRGYAFAPFTTLKATESVTTRTKSGTSAPAGKSPSLTPIVKFDPRLPSPMFVTGKQINPADVGTATHLALEHLNFGDSSSDDAIRAQLVSLVNRRIMTSEQSSAVDVEALRWLLSTDIGQTLIASRDRLHREVPVSFPDDAVVDGKLLESTDPMDRVMVRGRIDLLIPTSTGWLVADYKTDRVTPETIEARAIFYIPQLNAYAKALARIIAQPVEDACLIFLHARQMRRFKVS